MSQACIDELLYSVLHKLHSEQTNEQEMISSLAKCNLSHHEEHGP